MNPIFSKKEVLSILNSTEMYGDYTLRENSLDSRMFTEAVKQGEDIAEQLVGVDTDVQKALAKITTIQESISKNILYNAIVYNNDGGFYLPKNEVETFNFTNLANTSIPRVLNLKNALDSAAEKLFPNGVSVGRNVISIKNQNDADMFYRVMKATCKSIKEKKANISAELFNDSSIVDSNDLSVKAYAYYRGGDVVSRKVVKCDAQEIKTRKALAEKLGVVVKNYDDSCIAVCTSLTSLVKKLSTPVEFYNKQTQNQLEYLKNKLKRLFICYTVEYLYRANLVYAAHADAISEYFTVFSKNKDKALERPVSTTVDGDILSNMESTISLDESFDDFEATDDYKRNVEFFDGRMYNTVGDYLHMNSMLESYIDEFYEVFVQEAIGDTANNLANKLNTAANKANTAAKAAEATGDSNTRFRKIWAAFLNFMNNIVSKFRGSMDQRIKACSEFIDANQQKILDNVKIIPGTIEKPDYNAGLKLIEAVKMPEAKTVLDPAATGTLTSVDEIESSIKFGGNNAWNPKTNKESFVDYAKNMFINGGTQPQTTALNTLPVQDMMKFCKDATGYNNLANSLKDDLDRLGNATTDKLTQLASQQKVVGQAQTTTPHENAGFKRYDNIESFIENYLDAFQEGVDPVSGREVKDNTTSGSGSTSTATTTSSDKTSNNKKDPNEPEVKGVETSGSGENKNTDFSKTVISASTNFQNALKSLHTSKLTAYEYIYVKYMEVLRIIANYNPNNAQQANNNQQQNNAK